MTTAGIQPLPLKPIKPLRTSLRRFEKRQLILPFSEKRATLPLNLQHFSGKCSPGPPGGDSCTLWAPLGVTGSLLLLLGTPWSDPWISFGAPCVPLGLSFVSLWSPLCRPGASRGALWTLLEPSGAAPGAQVGLLASLWVLRSALNTRGCGTGWPATGVWGVRPPHKIKT